MPHVIVKLLPGRSEEQKNELTRQIVQSVVSTLNCKKEVVSVGFEEIDDADWARTVYKPDILDKESTLYRKPGYNPFSSETKKEEKPSLMEFVRESARIAEQEDTSGHFNAMTWMDLLLEDNPQTFDEFFNTPWNGLTDDERQKRCAAIRRVL